MEKWIDFQAMREQADFAAILAHYGIELPRGGRRQIKVRCPFHEDGSSTASAAKPQAT